MAEEKKKAIKVEVDFDELLKGVGDLAGKFAGGAEAAFQYVKDHADKVKEGAEQLMEKIDIYDIISASMKVPGVKIRRADFLKKELTTRYPQEVVDKAIFESPAAAGIPLEEIHKIADTVIAFEAVQVAGVAAALGLPGGLMNLATVPADLAQYYGYSLRVAQKLMYLYSFPEVDFDNLDDARMHALVLFLGAMVGANKAANGVRALARVVAGNIAKRLPRKALTKTAIYSLAKSASKYLMKEVLSKQVFADGVAHAVLGAGAVIGGGATLAFFIPSCHRLKSVLSDTIFVNPNYVPNEEEEKMIIDITEAVKNAETDEEDAD